MQYATLGRTGFEVSRLGFGAMRLPMKGDKVDRDLAIPMIHRAFEAGVNYIDSAIGYCNSDSQWTVGEALKGWRDKIVVSTKNHYYNKADDRPWWKNLEDSLKRLDVETIDIYNFHGLRWQAFEEHLAGPGAQLAWMQKAKDQGLIRHICFSFHDTAENLVKLAKTGEFDSVTLQYNLLDRSNEPALAAVRKAGMGVVVMGPVGGGRLGSPSEALRKMIPGAKSVPEVALRFVLANPNVTVALSGMSEMAHVEENVRVAAKTTPLSAAEKRRVTATLKRYKKLADLYCTGCDYCMPCPAGVEIPRNFSALNTARVYELPDNAKQQYQWTKGKASACLACGKCLEKCPQHIDIIAQLRETVRTLDDAYGKLIVRVKPTEVARLRRRDGAFDATIACRLECHNLSDEPLEPDLSFSPATGLSLKLSRPIGPLGPFERGRTRLTLEAKAFREGRPLKLGAALAGEREMIFDQDPLALAIAPMSLDEAPLVRAEVVGGPIAPTPKARASHALAARFASDADALTIEFDLNGDFRRPPTARRGMRQSDNLWLNLDLRDAKGLKLRKDAPTQLILGFGIPAAKTGPMPIEIHRPRRAKDLAQQIRAEVTARGQRRKALIHIPWAALQVSSPKPNARLGVNFGLTCWPPRGRAAWTLSWAQGGRGHLLLP